MALELTTITPEIAAQLTGNVHPRQRKANRVAVRKYARRLLQGSWQQGAPTQPFLVDAKTGQLFNGLQRCMAVIESGIPMQVYIDRESDADAYFAVIDDGLTRRPHQFISAARAAIRASGARVQLWYRNDFGRPLGTTSNSMFSTEDITNEAERNEELYDRLMHHAVQIYERTGISTGVALAALALFDDAGYGDEAVFFAEKVHDPQGLALNDPAWRLVDRQSKRIHRLHSRQPLEDWCLLVRHMNAEVLGYQLPSKVTSATSVWPAIGEDEASLRRRANNEQTKKAWATRRKRSASTSSAEGSAASMAADGA